MNLYLWANKCCRQKHLENSITIELCQGLQKQKQVFLLSYFCITDEKVINAVAEDKYIGEVQLGGDTIGIKINTNVEIVGKYEINVNNQKVKPWINSNIEEGDFIYSIDDKIITCNNDLNNIISQSNKETLNLKLIRNNQLIYTTINVFKNANDNNSIGLYVKDHITGIGTLTFNLTLPIALYPSVGIIS